ncbi:MAG: metallophosphoesterase [Anaerolineae bacterium]|nr:metallophosphoesterase [Anaerolineae bacterium]
MQDSTIQRQSQPTRFWALADTHLSFAKPRDMVRFGEKWLDHTARIAQNWRESIADQDVVLLPGDVSWAQATSRIWSDLMWLRPLPGRKILLRGNHDHWWKDIDKVRKIVEPMGFYALEGDSITLDGVIIAGAMGHIAPGDPFYKEDAVKDRYNRELQRLERALMHAAVQRRHGEPVLLMTHYPPFTSEGQRTAYVDVISRYQPTICLYGHLHSQREWEVAKQGQFEGVEYMLVAADYLDMKPRLIWTQDHREEL